MRDPDAEKAVKKLNIAQAALRVFQRNGFSQTKVDEICREAGIAKGTYYLYFDSKEQVILSIFSEVMDSAVSPLVLDPAMDPAEKVIGIIRGSIDRGRERLEMVPVIWEVAGHKIVQSKYQLNDKINKFFDSLSKVVGAILKEGQESGSIDPSLDAAAFARMLTSAVDGIILHAALFYKDDGAFLKRQTDSLIEMIRGYLSHEKDRTES